MVFDMSPLFTHFFSSKIAKFITLLLSFKVIETKRKCSQAKINQLKKQLSILYLHSCSVTGTDSFCSHIAWSLTVYSAHNIEEFIFNCPFKCLLKDRVQKEILYFFLFLFFSELQWNVYEVENKTLDCSKKYSSRFIRNQKGDNLICIKPSK